MLLAVAPVPAAAWDDYDRLRICNTNPRYSVEVAYATRSTPWGLAGVFTESWRREGWFQVAAGSCVETMPLDDVRSYRVWLYVDVVGGGRVSWQSRDNLKMCANPGDAFNQSGLSISDMTRCGQGEKLAEFSYMGIVENLDDAYSMYRVDNRTIELDFSYQP